MTIIHQALEPLSGAVTAEIKNSLGVVVKTLTLVSRGDNFYSESVGTLANGTYTVVIKNNSEVIGLNTLNWNDQKEIDIEYLRKIFVNNMKIINDQLIIYDNDGTTVLETFDLFNSSGDPTEVEVTEIRNA